MGPMEGRWVCRRCFASNDADATTCEQCGLERGADPASAQAAAALRPDHQQQWAAPPQPAARPMWLQLVQRFWFVGLIVIVAGVGWYLSARRDDTGQITSSGNMEMSDLRVGDCFDLKDPEESEVEEVEAKPCNVGHQYELYHLVEMPGAEYPSDNEFTAFLQNECVPAFNAYVGMDYEVSALDILPFTPTTELWDSGDHGVQCTVYDPDDAELTSSLRGAAR
jgi:hypothetical protein